MSKDYNLLIRPTPACDLKAGSLIDVAGCIAHITTVRAGAAGRIRVMVVFNGQESRFDYLPSQLITVLVNPW